MKSNSIFKIFRKRDFLVVFLIALSFYLTYDSADFVYELQPSWYLPRGKSAFSWKAIPPIVTDMDGDGKREVVVLTNDMHLKILSADRKTPGDGIYAPVELVSKLLTHSVTESHKLPVAMKTGYKDPYSNELVRDQIIVVVLEDWTVICYDAELNILWEKEVGHFSMSIEKMKKWFRIDSVNIHISPINIVHEEEGKDASDNGLVVIGASMAYIDDTNHTTGQNAHDFERVHIESGFDMNEDGEEEHPDMALRTQLEHFSMYALSAHSGKVVWKHDGTELRSEQYTKSMPQHAIDRLSYVSRSDLALQAHHTVNSNDWTVFRDSLINELPHDWHSRDDTTMRLAHFVRQHIGARANVQASSRKHNSPKVKESLKHSIENSKARLSALAAANNAGSNLNNLFSKREGVASKQSKRESSGKQVNSLYNRGEDPTKTGGLGVPSEEAMRRKARKEALEAERWELTEFRRAHAGGDGIRMPEVPSQGVGHEIFPHDAIEHIQYPNVMVAHTQHGLDVVSLVNGMPVTGLSLVEETSYSDVNGDGVVDSIIVLENEQGVNTRGSGFAHHEGELMPCTMLVVSGLPATSQLFNASLCSAHANLQDSVSSFSKRSKMASQKASSAEVKAASPLILRKMNEKVPSIEDRVKDIVVAINTGVISCFTGLGKFKWQVRGGPLWNMDFQHASVVHYDFDFYRATEELLEQYGSTGSNYNHPYSFVLVVGQFGLSLIDRDGEVLSYAEIPEAPVSIPILSDFDHDGITDVILTTNEAVLGYSVKISLTTPFLFISVCILSVLAFVVFVGNIKSELVMLPQGGMMKMNQGNNSRRLYSMQRSTDNEHQD